jgi:hexokinase
MFDKNQLEKLLLENGIHPGNIDLDAEVEKFKGEMVAGLNKNGGSSLLMLPTYIGASGRLPRGQSAVVIDAGGTNLRVALVRFDDKGSPNTEYFENYPMPGSLKAITKDEMFDTIARYTAPVAEGCDRIGFCFSYVFESFPNRDGKVSALCKEVEVSGIEGVMAGAELDRAYRSRGMAGGKSYVRLNDTVATLLGARAVHGDENCDGYVGFILGTGLNACYVESLDRIKKLPAGGYAAPSMIINTECGVYTGFAQGSIDAAIDAKSQFPGDHVYEKMISGGYFGDVLHGALALAGERGFLSGGFRRALEDMGTVDLKEITGYILEREPETNRYCRLASQNDGDRAVLDALLHLLYERAARMLVAMFTAVAEEAGYGGDPARPLRVCAEGTTYYKSPLLLRYLGGLLEEYAAGRRGRHIEMVKTANATLIGTALAALIN